MTISEIIAKRLDLRQQQVENTMELLEGGATIPFISRYRKEATGGLNEVQVAQINDLNTQLGELVHRREYILETIEAQGKLTDALRPVSYTHLLGSELIALSGRSFSRFVRLSCAHASPLVVWLKTAQRFFWILNTRGRQGKAFSKQK